MANQLLRAFRFQVKLRKSANADRFADGHRAG